MRFLSFVVLALSSARFVASQDNNGTGTISAADLATAQKVISAKRTTNLLLDIPGLIPYPSSPPSNATVKLDFDNIQGDILVGMHKDKQVFIFFSINNIKLFKATLKAIVPLITTSKQLMNVLTQPMVALNVAFSQTGLTTLNVTDNLGDAVFSAGQFADAAFLGDPGTDGWKPAFKGTSIHGVFLLASDSLILTTAMETVISGLFGTSITIKHRLLGNVRPGAQAGHEMFGYLDGIAQPAIAAFQPPFPGQQVVDPGVILLGEPGDPITRPAWAKDGSFLAFRQLQQLVPEFGNFVETTAPAVPGLNHSQSVDLFGARLVGRWKSGAPVDNFSLVDNPSVGTDPMQNNNFDYSHPGFNISNDQSHCPFSAHIRKTRPRADLIAPANSIMRSGIPYGPEVSSAEAASGQSSTAASQERGLAFVAYQAQLARGFQFLQHSWADNQNFIFGKNVSPGFDPIIGANAGAPRTVVGTDVTNTTRPIALPTDWVVSRGGEYFFSPSISAIKTVIVA